MNVHEVFQAIDRRLDKTDRRRCSADFLVAGRHIRFISDDEDQLRLVRTRMRAVLTEDWTQEVDATFLNFQDDVRSYLPEKERALEGHVFESQDETGSLTVVNGKRLTGVDRKMRKFYHIRDFRWEEKVFIYTPMCLLADWALESGMMLMHSACVGAGGKGVLMGAWGGGGKSTLSVSCLLRDDMEFVSDDYTLVDAQGPMTAYPMNSFVSLNPDMYGKVQPDFPVIQVLDSQGGKLQMDASVRPFARQLTVRAIIAPRVTHQAVPYMASCPDGPVKVRIITSSVRQTGHGRDTALVQKMLGRLSGLPVYEFGLSEDLHANTDFLKDFIEKL